MSKTTFFNKGHEAWEKGDVRTALKCFLAGARQKDASCQQVLGYFYDEGIGVPRSLKKAIYWYQKSARRGSSSAAYNLGLLYVRKKRLGLATNWFKKALRLGERDAEQRLVALAAKAKTIRKSPAQKAKLTPRRRP